MNILLLGGFLGSGKTTILSRLMHQMLDQGLRLCVIENEIGQVSIDDLYMKQSGIEITTIMGGCVCCQVSGSLLESLLQIEDKINPDWVLVELTGLAKLDELKNTIIQYWSGAGKIVSVCVVDGSRWSKLKKAVFPLISKQLSGGDVIVLNKTDICSNVELVLEELQQIVPGRRCICLQGNADAVVPLLATIL